MKRLAGLLVLGALLALTACSSAAEPQKSPTADAAASTESQVTTMPALEGATVREAAATLARTPFAPTVTFPGYRARWLEEAHNINGTEVPAHDEVVSVDSRRLALRKVDAAMHLVVKQAPAAGTTLTPSTSITLEAGAHPNGTDEPWLTSGHKAAIRKSGAEPCFECHLETECSDCHTELMDN